MFDLEETDDAYVFSIKATNWKLVFTLDESYIKVAHAKDQVLVKIPTDNQQILLEFEAANKRKTTMTMEFPDSVEHEYTINKSTAKILQELEGFCLQKKKSYRCDYDEDDGFMQINIGKRIMHRPKKYVWLQDPLWSVADLVRLSNNHPEPVKQPKNEYAHMGLPNPYTEPTGQFYTDHSGKGYFVVEYQNGKRGYEAEEEEKKVTAASKKTYSWANNMNVEDIKKVLKIYNVAYNEGKGTAYYKSLARKKKLSKDEVDLLFQDDL